MLVVHTLGEVVASSGRNAIGRSVRGAYSAGVFINDIGFADRLKIYLRHGIDAIVGDYIYRKKCAEKEFRFCQIGQIPSAENIPRILDSLAYERAAQLLYQANPSLRAELIQDNVEPALRGEYMRLVREVIIPQLVEEYLEEYWSDRPSIYSERKQRNRSMSRLRCREGSYNWCEVRKALRMDPRNVLVLEDMEVRLLRGRTGAPRCRAILLSLFEDIALTHEELLVLADSGMRNALEEAQNVYLNIARSLPADAPFRLRWSLSFKNEFWENGW